VKKNAANGGYLIDIASMCNAQVSDHLKVGAEIGLPAAVAEEKYSGKEASAADCSIPKKLPWNKRDFGKGSLPDCQSNHEYDAKDKKADDQSRVLSVRFNGVKVE
jgi:hypothetical protein